MGLTLPNLYLVNLKLKFTGLKLVRFLRKFICRYLQVLVLIAVSLKKIKQIVFKKHTFKDHYNLQEDTVNFTVKLKLHPL